MQSNTSSISISVLWFLAGGAVAGCAGTSTPEPSAADTPTKPESMEISGSRAEYYRGAFPDAKEFVSQPIPDAMVRSINRGNSRYIEARGDDGHVLGYLRDFVGPISANESCPCDPLNVTLVFDQDKKFSALLTPGPLYKWGKEAMSELEISALTEIIKDPDPELLAVTSPEALVDAKSGATQKRYESVVISRAALTTQRLVALAEHSERILNFAPQKRDQQLLGALLSDKALTGKARLDALADFVENAESDALREEAYPLLAFDYPDQAEKEPDPRVERVLLNARVDREIQIYACYLLADRALRNEVTEECASRSSSGSNSPLEARLAGTVAFNQQQYSEALLSLQIAADAIDHLVDPALHYRLAAAAQKSGDETLACQTAKRLYRDAPLYPGVEELLSSCDYRDGVAALRDEIEQSRRQRVLNGEHPNPAKVPTLILENDDSEEFETDLTADERMTIAVFFATWCPHCRKELPKIVDFQRQIRENPKLSKRVRVLAIRTMVEREREEFQAFKDEFQINFPVYTDPAMGTAFSAFAGAQELDRPGLPTVAVIDTTGDVRYFLRSYSYSDTAKELTWILDDILAKPTSEQ